MGIIGIDEVGRGPWAGPVVAAAVYWPDCPQQIPDSKQLSAKEREAYFYEIQSSASGIGIGWVHAREIDATGLTQSIAKAMELSVKAVGITNCPILIDGAFNFLPHIKGVTTKVKADASEPCVASASIIAKVARDRFMALMAKRYPDFGFESHVGYGTAKHQAALKQFGLTPLHRRSFKPIQALL